MQRLEYRHTGCTRAPMAAVESMFLLQNRGANEVDGEVWLFPGRERACLYRRRLM